MLLKLNSDCLRNCCGNSNPKNTIIQNIFHIVNTFSKLSKQSYKSTNKTGFLWICCILLQHFILQQHPVIYRETISFEFPFFQRKCFHKFQEKNNYNPQFKFIALRHTHTHARKLTLMESTLRTQKKINVFFADKNVSVQALHNAHFINSYIRKYAIHHTQFACFFFFTSSALFQTSLTWQSLNTHSEI